MRGRYLLLLAATGCADFAGIGDPAPLAPDAPPPRCQFDNIDLCLYASPQNELALNDDLMLNTDRDCDLVYNNPIGRSACVLYAKTITINANITPRGSRALILAATDSIEINATVDLSAALTSALNTITPAAANDRDCVPATVDAAGAGGSFNGKGGDGGADEAGMVALAAPAIALPDFLRGGCGGSVTGPGGNDQGKNVSPSGGAVALVAGNTIAITSAGKILANGAGGLGGLDGYTGGGGGGSGGMIKLVATTIANAGVITANGGGGGEGADGTTAGTPGANATGTAMTAAGGSGHAGGGDGGAGGAGTTANGTSGMNVAGMDTDADGGGGGGAGFIAISGELTGGGTVSPTPTPLQ